MSEKVIVDPLESWQGGKATGYYEPYTNTIHILNGEDAALRAEIHEREHAKRRTTITFRLALILKIPVFQYIYIGILAMVATYGILVADVTPFILLATVFLFLMFCEQYEEAQANYAMTRWVKNRQRNGGHIP